MWNAAGLCRPLPLGAGGPRSGAPQSPLWGTERGPPQRPSVFRPPRPPIVRRVFLGSPPRSETGAEVPQPTGGRHQEPLSPSGPRQSPGPRGGALRSRSPHSPRSSPGSPQSAAAPRRGGGAGGEVRSVGLSVGRGGPSALSTPAPGAGAAGGAGSRC